MEKLGLSKIIWKGAKSLGAGNHLRLPQFLLIIIVLEMIK